MLRWTENTDIRNIHNELVATKIDKEIWMAHGTPGTHPMLVFDIENKAFRDVQCQYEQDVPYSFVSLASHGNTIYMWARNEEWDFELYQMSTNILVWSKILTLYSNEISANMSNVTIIGDQMYLLDQSLEEDLKLITIDLTKKTSDMTFAGEYYEGETNYLMTNNEKLYMITQDGENRGVYILENGDVLLCETEPCEYFTENNGYTNHFIYSHGDEYKLEVFNFDNERWKTTMVEKWRGWMIEYHWPVDDKIYAITKEGIQYSIRVLDSDPTLTDICLFTFIDEIVSYRVHSNEREARVAELKKKLPIPLRKNLDHLLLWRLREVDLPDPGF